MALARLYDLETGTFTLYDDGRPEDPEPYAEPTLEYLKTVAVREQKNMAYSFLRATDWYITRSMELGIINAPVPEVVTQYRNAVRQAADARCAVINAAVDKAALTALTDNLYAALTAAVQWPADLDVQYLHYQ